MKLNPPLITPLQSLCIDNMASEGEEKGEEIDDYMAMDFGQVVEREPEHDDDDDDDDVKRQHEDSTTEKINKALKTPLDDNLSKGLKLMQKMGYKEGSSLGSSSSDGVTEPVVVELKHGREGIGYEREQKRRREEKTEKAEGQEKQAKKDFRSRLRQEKEEKRLLYNIRKAQKLCISLDYTDPEFAYRKADLNTVPVIYRGYIKEIRDTENFKLMRKLRLAERDDAKYDNEVLENYEEDSKADEELHAYLDLTPESQLNEILEYLRGRHYHCFWCQITYQDKQDLNENCPGITEDEHE